MNFLFFEHPNGRERVNLSCYFSVELFKFSQDRKERWSILFHRSLTYEDKPMAWNFSSEDEAREVFASIAAVMQDYLYAAVLPDYIISKDYIEYVNASPSEDGWSLFLHVRIGNDFDVFDFPCDTEDEAMTLYRNAFIVA